MNEEFDIEKWNKVKKMEFLRNGGPEWKLDFGVDTKVNPEILNKLRKMHETSLK